MVQILYYRGSPTCMVSTGRNSTSANFSSTVLKFVLMEFLISKIVLEFSLQRSLPNEICMRQGSPVCTTQLVRILHSTLFPGPCTKLVLSGDPLY